MPGDESFTVSRGHGCLAGVISNSYQEKPSYAGETRMGYRLSNRRQRRNDFHPTLKIIGESVGCLVSVLQPPFGSLPISGWRRVARFEPEGSTSSALP